MITNDLSGNITTYYGLSTDIKPEKAVNGSAFFEMDTFKVYFYNESAAGTASDPKWITKEEE